MTTIVKPNGPTPAADEFAPMAPAAVRQALRGNSDALVVWLEAMARPDGWQWGDRQRIAGELGMTVYAVRKAIRALRAAGLYLVEKYHDAAGQIRTRCRIVADAFSQVTPKVDLPGFGGSARIPLTRERKRRRGFSRSAAARTRPERPAALPCDRPVAAVLSPAAPTPAPFTPCEHGRRPAACLTCAKTRT
jgi:hypothetical protein